MAVGLEFVSLVLKRSAIDLKYPGGSDAYLKECGDCVGISVSYDEFLIRQSAMSSRDLEQLIQSWQSYGLIVRKRVKSKMSWIDMCVVHAFCGPSKPCDWLAFDQDTQSVSFF